MLLKDCYDAFGGSYESVRQRISKEETILKFVKKFLSEPSFENLRLALQREDYAEAFRAAHSLKGVSANLGFLKLTESSGALTELLRACDVTTLDREACNVLFDRVAKDYDAVTDAIRQLDE